MDRHLKERLVGAAVLVAAAIILIPEMLSGPRDPNIHTGDKSAGNDGGVKTYTIDLRAPKTEDTATRAPLPLPLPTNDAVETTPAPPDEMSGVQPDAKEKSKDKAEAELKSAVTEKPALQKPETEKLPAAKAPETIPPQKSTTEKIVAEKSVAQKPVAVATNKPVPTKNDSAPLAAKKSESPAKPTASVANASNKWAVQVASFSTRANAEKAVSELKSKGHAAFVSPFQSKGQTLYRVRVGPVADRPAAESLLHKVKTLYPGANVVAHP